MHKVYRKSSFSLKWSCDYSHFVLRCCFKYRNNQSLSDWTSVLFPQKEETHSWHQLAAKTCGWIRWQALREHQVCYKVDRISVWVLMTSCCAHRLICLSTLIRDAFICSRWWLTLWPTQSKEQRIRNFRMFSMSKASILCALLPRLRSL